MSDLISIEEAARRYKRGHRALQKAAARGRLKAFKIGRDWVVEVSEAARYVSEVRLGRPPTPKPDAETAPDPSPDAPKRRGRPRKAPKPE